MYMSMKKVTGFEFIHKPEEGFESCMAGILLIVYSPGGRMGQEDIQVPPVTHLVPQQSGNKVKES